MAGKVTELAEKACTAKTPSSGGPLQDRGIKRKADPLARRDILSRQIQTNSAKNRQGQRSWQPKQSDVGQGRLPRPYPWLPWMGWTGSQRQLLERETELVPLLQNRGRSVPQYHCDSDLCPFVPLIFNCSVSAKKYWLQNWASPFLFPTYVFRNTCAALQTNTSEASLFWNKVKAYWKYKRNLKRKQYFLKSGNSIKTPKIRQHRDQ